MITVTFSSISSGENKKVTDLTWDGQEYRTNPPEPILLDSVLETSPNMAKQNPVEFMRGLAFRFRSPYLTASVAVETE